MKKPLIDKEIKLVTGGVDCQVKIDITSPCAESLGTSMNSSTYVVDTDTAYCLNLASQIKLEIDNDCGVGSANVITSSSGGTTSGARGFASSSTLAFVGLGVFTLFMC